MECLFQCDFIFRTLISVFALALDYLKIGKPSNKSNYLSVNLSWSYEYSVLVRFLNYIDIY